jgi:putative tryptophan/tyrosine transport system substrate-binding protein
MFGMKRREFMALLGGAAAAWPLAAPTVAVGQQNERMRHLGVLMGIAENDQQTGPFLRKFKRALQELGWIEGRNIQADYRFGASDIDRIQKFAKEIVSSQPDLIVGHTTPATAALARETNTIPIIFLVVSDPVGSGFVASLARPGGNMTGFVNIEASMGGKWVEFLKEISPRLARVAFIYNPETAPHPYYLPPFEAAARALGLEPMPSPVRSTDDIEAVIRNLGKRSDGGLAVMPDTFTSTLRVYHLIISLAAHHRVPTIYPYRYMAAAGGLLSYGTDNVDLFRRAPDYIDRVLRGAKPAELPVQLPTKFEFVVNLRTARALDIDIPLKLRAFADEVIE